MYREKTKDGTVRLTGGALQAYPIGAIYMSVQSTNPATFFGGSWTAIGQGRVLIGQDPSQPEYDTAEETGGSEQVTLATSQMPEHTHTAGSYGTTSDGSHDHTAGSYATTSDGSHDHNVNRRNSAGTGGGTAFGGGTTAADLTTSTSGSHSHSVQGSSGTGGSHSHSVQGSSGPTGSGNPINIVQPYLVVYMWKRVS